MDISNDTMLVKNCRYPNVGVGNRISNTPRLLCEIFSKRKDIMLGSRHNGFFLVCNKPLIIESAHTNLSTFVETQPFEVTIGI